MITLYSTGKIENHSTTTIVTIVSLYMSACDAVDQVKDFTISCTVECTVKLVSGLHFNFLKKINSWGKSSVIFFDFGKKTNCN